MVDAPAALATEAEVQGRDPDMLQERREVRAGSERFDAQIGPLPRLLPELGRARVGDGVKLGPLPGAELGLRILDVPRHVVDERLERVRASHVQRSEEHTSELQSHGLISYAVFCLKK